MQYYARIKKQKDGKFLVVFPDLKGCLTEGETLAEAKANAAEALNLWLDPSHEEDSAYPIPKPRRRTSKDYFPIDVDPLLIPALALKQTRLKMGWPRSRMAKELGISVLDYASCERPVGMILPRGNRQQLKAKGVRSKKGVIAVRVTAVKKRA